MEDRSMTKQNGMDRREFVKTTTGAAAAVALGPTVWIKRPQKSLKILQWSHFVPSYDGTKWLHWRILSDFCGRLIHTVGPSATAAAAPVVVFTNSRRSIPFCLVMDLSSIGSKKRCQVSGSWHLTPDTWHRSQRVQHAEGDLVGADGPSVVAGRRAEPLQPERVAPRAVAQQGVADVTQLAGERTARLAGEPRRVRLVHAVKRPEAPVGIE